MEIIRVCQSSYLLFPLLGNGSRNGSIAPCSVELLFVGSGRPFGKELPVDRGEKLGKALPVVMQLVERIFLQKPILLVGWVLRRLELLEVRRFFGCHDERFTYRHWWCVSECE